MSDHLEETDWLPIFVAELRAKNSVEEKFNYLCTLPVPDIVAVLNYLPLPESAELAAYERVVQIRNSK